MIVPILRASIRQRMIYSLRGRSLGSPDKERHIILGSLLSLVNTRVNLPQTITRHYQAREHVDELA